MQESKLRQKEHTDRKFASLHPIEFGTNRYSDHFRRIPYERLRRLLDQCHVDLNNKNVFIAGCGSGIDIHYLRKLYNSKFLVSDISENSIKTVLRTFPFVEARVEDMEELSFSDNTFDYSFVAYSLHHLSMPVVGLYELLRVSKQGVIFIEPNDSWITRFFTRLGIATRVEPAYGNYVYRFGKREIEKICGSLFYSYSVKRCFAGIHKRIPRNSIEFWAFRIFNSIANKTVPFWGNDVVCLIEKLS